MALGDKEKRDEVKRLLETADLDESVKQRVRDYLDNLENGDLAKLLEDIKRRSGN